MNFIRPFIEPAIAAGKVALLVGLFGAGFYLGQRLEAGKHAEAAAARAAAETAAVLARIRNNERIAEQQEIDRQRIEKTHHDEVAKVRADLARAPGLRVGLAICSEFAGATDGEGSAGGDEANTAGRLVREDVRRDIDALKMEVEEALATGRACQTFVQTEGLIH